MGFADHYISRHCIFPPQIKSLPNPGLHIIVVIPCFDEPDLLRSLESLLHCDPPESPVEVIVIINSGTGTPHDALERNVVTQHEAVDWMQKHNCEKFMFHCLHQAGLPRKHAGVGLARKIGMDEAIYRFTLTDNPDGIIACFDADAVCDKNYLVEIESKFNTDKKANACSVYFEHPLEGTDFPAVVYEGIAGYELYLRYYYQALRFTGFPFAYHTVGSSFAVRAKSYVHQGGMNRKQAGEDFYFLQKVIPHGKFIEINSTRVIPSPRPSVRVPFGTGATIHKLLEHEISDVETYHFQAFRDLKELFRLIPELYTADKDYIEQVIAALPAYMADWLVSVDFMENIREIEQNSSGLEAFIKRFFLHFNSFKILKFLNHAHERHFSKQAIQDVAIMLLDALKINYTNKDAKSLLMIFREMERIGIFGIRLQVSGSENQYK
jgi:hypothetical protein